MQIPANQVSKHLGAGLARPWLYQVVGSIISSLVGNVIGSLGGSVLGSLVGSIVCSLVSSSNNHKGGAKPPRKPKR